MLLGALSRVSIWTTAEPCLGIFSSCLPTMGPLLRRHRSQKDYRMPSQFRARSTAFIRGSPFTRKTDASDQSRSDTTKPSTELLSIDSVDSSETYPDHNTIQGLTASITSDTSASSSDSELGLMLEDRRE